MKMGLTAILIRFSPIAGAIKPGGGDER